jgi:hypothetical protein
MIGYKYVCVVFKPINKLYLKKALQDIIVFIFFKGLWNEMEWKQFN